MKKLLFVLAIILGVVPEFLQSQATDFPYSEGFEKVFNEGKDNFIPNWFRSHDDGIKIFQEDIYAKSGNFSLSLWPVTEEGEDEEEVEIYAQTKLDLSNMENVVVQFWLATRATGAMKHVKLYMQTSVDGGISFGPKLIIGSDPRGFSNENSDFTKFLYALHPATFDGPDVVLRFLAKAGARKGTVAKILIDDVLVYAAEQDIFPPIALEPRPLNVNEISIGFSEPVSDSALDISNYTLNLLPIEGIAEISNEGDAVILHLSSPISIGKYYELGITGIEDLAGNKISPSTSNIIYNPLKEGLVITEILFDEPPAGQNDDLEFIEFYNATNDPMELGGLKIKGGITSGALPEFTLAPGDFWVTAKNATAFTNFFGVPAYEWHGANLSNDEPETIYVINTDHHSDVRIDLITYGIGDPWPEGAAGKGYSMELCNPALDNSLSENWNNAIQYAGNYKGYEIYASPGKACCTSEIIVDAGPDKVVYKCLPEKFGCAKLNVSVTGGNPPYIYSWSSLPDVSGPEVEVCPEVTTTYTVTVKDSYGCKNTGEITVFVKTIWENDKMKLCYNGKTLTVAPAAANAFIKKGAAIGECEETTGTSNLLEQTIDINIYPNPSSGIANISFQPLFTTEASVEVYNFSGQRMKTLFSGEIISTKSYNFEMNAANWPDGIYILVVRTNQKSYSQKFIKRK